MHDACHCGDGEKSPGPTLLASDFLPPEFLKEASCEHYCTKKLQEKRELLLNSPLITVLSLYMYITVCISLRGCCEKNEGAKAATTLGRERFRIPQGFSPISLSHFVLYIAISSVLCTAAYTDATPSSRHSGGDISRVPTPSFFDTLGALER